MADLASPQRVFITGATGHLGAHLVRWLVQQGCEVAVLLRETSNPWRIASVLPRLHVFTGDLMTIPTLQGAMNDFAPDAIFHLAWSGVTGLSRNASENIVPNVCGSLQLCNMAATCGCKTLICLGSQAEYGRMDTPRCESDPIHPESVYGVTKTATRTLCELMAQESGLRLVWVRLSAIYGPMDHEQFVLPYTITTLLRGERPSLTLGEQRWDYIYVDDAVRALWALATTETAQGIFNLGSGAATPIRDIVTLIRDQIDPALPLGLGDIPYGPQQMMELQLDIARLTSVTGWCPSTPLLDGLKKTIAWYR
ncbi:MAG TPA: NAD(P)-dependent oxidoreductase, partial [Armatimonadota bacterium]|nr:NAD(P)-dependent oxidoreductase [Armatimonadota bacterium]